MRRQRLTSPHNRTCKELCMMGLAIFAAGVAGGVSSIIALVNTLS